jgi:hypothetical protein
MDELLAERHPTRIAASVDDGGKAIEFCGKHRCGDVEDGGVRFDIEALFLTGFAYAASRVILEILVHAASPRGASVISRSISETGTRSADPIDTAESRPLLIRL